MTFDELHIHVYVESPQELLSTEASGDPARVISAKQARGRDLGHGQGCHMKHDSPLSCNAKQAVDAFLV